MFDNLLESKRKKAKGGSGALASLLLHAGILGFAVVVTANAGLEAYEELRDEKVDFVEIKKETPPEVKPPPPDVVVTTPPPKGFQVLTAPINIPDVIPEIDLSKKMTDDADFTGKGGVAGGTATGIVGGTPQPIQGDQTFYEFQVEKPAAAAPNNPAPTYPDFLKNAGIEGSVLVQFVIDTEGRADMSTFKVLQSTHDQFSAAVRAVLPRYRFFPAEVGGRKVKQVVQLPFAFNIR